MEDTNYQIDLLTALNEKLMNSERIYRHIAEYSGNLYVYFDLRNNGKVELIGPWDDFVGERILSHPYDEQYMLNLVFEDDQKEVRSRILEIERLGRKRDKIEFRTAHKKYWLSCEATVNYDSHNEPLEKLLTIRDITRLKNNYDELTYLAYYDSLTSLCNRNYFVKRFNDIIEKADQEKAGVELMLVDIDNFKRINDSLGLVYGDELVQSFAFFLKELEGEDVVIGRYGSDVFSILIFNPHNDKTSDGVYKKIRERLRKPFKLSDGSVIDFTVTCGVSEYPDAGKNSLEVLKNAEIILYKAKESGKDCIKYYDPDVLSEFMKSVDLETKLKDAFENEDFELYFQPQFDLKTGKLRGAEALIRWPDKNNGFICEPEEFIPIAEKNGSISPLGSWIIIDAVKTINEWRTRFHLPIVISVNISAMQLEKDNFVDSLQKIISEYDVSPEMFEIEITESVFINDFDDVIDKINTLRGYGIRVSLDDFGTGYSSLSYLKRLPIDTLKIDKGFIDTAITDTTSRVIYETVVSLANKLGYQTIAEGVETKEQLEFLQKIKCDMIQGFLLGKPMRKDEFEKFLIRQL